MRQSELCQSVDQEQRLHVKPRICFVAHNAYSALVNANTGHIGGIEWQQTLMARWLAGRGHSVSMITWDEGQGADCVVDGVRVLRMCAREAGVRGLRFFHPKWTSLCRAMQRADADVYYYNCGDLGLGQVVMWSRRHGRKCVYSVASNPDCDPKLPALKSRRERLLYRYGVTHADCVIVQTQQQQCMLQKGFGVRASVIPMPCEGLGGGDAVQVQDVPRGEADVLWVGRLSREKRFEWLLDVAERCPEITFNVVGAANSESSYVTLLMKRSVEIPNVRMHGRVPHSRMGEYYRHGTVLCCTSAYEGFPNTFLEAWSCGIPVVSTFDPDDVIQKNRLGFAVQDTEGMVRRLREISQSRETWLNASKAAREYFLANHASEVCLPKFERLFWRVTDHAVSQSAHGLCS